MKSFLEYLSFQKSVLHTFHDTYFTLPDSSQHSPISDVHLYFSPFLSLLILIEIVLLARSNPKTSECEPQLYFITTNRAVGYKQQNIVYHKLIASPKHDSIILFLLKKNHEIVFLK